jgi:zinc carboxypeptidase
MGKDRLAGQRAKAWASLALIVAAVALATPAPAGALTPPYDGNPISHGLGPTYGETWCANAAPGSSIASQQGAPLALIPYEAIGCTLAQIQGEATAAGVPHRMDYSIIGQSAGSRDVFGVVINALETADQQRDYDRWVTLRQVELTDPALARSLLAGWGDEVKIPIFIQSNIHGDEEEGTDAMMQAARDLVTLPRGTNPTVDKILDHAILIWIPSENPDGRFIGQRSNANNFDMNRDWLVQSQSEVRASIKLQQQWLATVGLDMHGYVNPTLIDGLTKPHNPGLEYDLFVKWNQRRLDANEAALAAVGMGITRPVNQWNASAGPGPGAGPATAEGWDDWGPFYTQTYMAFLGSDSSTLEMCRIGPGCDGRFGSKRAQYVGFYSSADYWLDHRHDLIDDQLEVFRRGVTDANRPNCCDDPLIAARGFTEAEHNWMVPYPKAFVVPFHGGGQRSDGEANRMVKWLLDNGVVATRTTSDFAWSGTTFPAGSYVVWMNQALRGLALTTLNAGQDISTRITQLYAPPGAWSHGLLWGADVVEIPRGDPAFTPATEPITEPNGLQGGVRGGSGAPSDWYSVTLRGPSEVRAVLGLLRSGVYGEVAEAPFASTTGGSMPAGTLIFPSDPATAAELDAAGAAAGIYFERNVGVAKPATTMLAEAPKVAILVNSATPATSDTSQSLKAIFGTDAAFVSVVTGANSLQNSPSDPLLAFDVIYNAGQLYPSATNATARARLNAFFARGGGYIGTSQSANNFTFLSGATLVGGSFTQGSSSAGGGITAWNNVGGASSPLTGGYPSSDYLYMPSNVTYFSATPTDAVVDGRNHPDMVGTAPNGPSPGFIAGLWRNRSAATNNAPVVVHGQTTAGSRYMGLSTNPFSRQDAEREWTLIGQAALWSDLTDEATSAITFPADGGLYNSAGFDGGCSSAICGTASAGSGPAISKVTVAVQQLESGHWWDGSAFASATPVYLDATGTTSWSFAFPASQFPADGDYLVRSKAIAGATDEQITPASATFTIDTTAPTIAIATPPDGAVYLLDEAVDADYGCDDALSGIATCDGPVPSGDPIDTGTVGFHSFTVTATDQAGNFSMQTNTYQVVWPFSGFFQPIDPPPALNVSKAGSSSPMKFKLGGYRGLGIFAAGYPQSRPISCSSRAPLGPGTATQGALSFSNGQYTYTWKTEKAWEGTCREFVMTLVDGSVHTAQFRFK